MRGAPQPSPRPARRAGVSQPRCCPPSRAIICPVTEGESIRNRSAAATSSGDVLRPSGGTTLPDGGAGLTVDDAAKQRAVKRFLDG